MISSSRGTRCPPEPDDFVFSSGTNLRVEWCYTPDGRMPAREYFFSLPELDQERLEMIVKHLADAPLGTRLPKSLYRVEDAANKIYAFKPRDERCFNFITDGRRIIITNAYRKHSRKMGRTDLDKLKTASAYRQDYLRRVGNGNSYENEA